ncbi:hypothetical protein F5888DRAFT_1635874 [Russula emetica]|nr:hypothetical protein F5888DRAFT_1635874 [Russula emetica]
MDDGRELYDGPENFPSSRASHHQSTMMFQFCPMDDSPSRRLSSSSDINRNELTQLQSPYRTNPAFCASTHPRGQSSSGKTARSGSVFCIMVYAQQVNESILLVPGLVTSLLLDLSPMRHTHTYGYNGLSIDGQIPGRISDKWPLGNGKGRDDDESRRWCEERGQKKSTREETKRAFRRGQRTLRQDVRHENRGLQKIAG